MTSPRPLKRQKTSLPDSINSFTLLPITLPSTLPSIPPVVHIIYLQRHQEPPRPPAVAPSESSRTIFLVNVPIDCTKELLRGLLASLGGRLEEVRFHEDKEQNSLPYVDRRLGHSGGTAHVTFPTSSDVDKTFKSIAKERKSQSGAIREWGVGVDLSSSSMGFKRYLTLHKQVYPDSVNLNATIDAALARFNEDESARMVSLKRMHSEPDEDGFITVTRRERDDVVVEKKNHAVDLEDFYKFQKREKRAKKMDELRRKFEEDKFKVARAKEGRKFKPF